MLGIEPKALPLALILCVFATSGYVQEKSILKVNGQQGAPLIITDVQGRSAEREFVSLRIGLKNSSEKAIKAVGIGYLATDSSGRRSSALWFKDFSASNDKPLAPQSKWSGKVELTLSAAPGAKLSEVSVEPIFVQFEDGSTWGDKGRLEEALSLRKGGEHVFYGGAPSEDEAGKVEYRFVCKHNCNAEIVTNDLSTLCGSCGCGYRYSQCRQ